MNKGVAVGDGRALNVQSRARLELTAATINPTVEFARVAMATPTTMTSSAAVIDMGVLLVSVSVLATAVPATVPHRTCGHDAHSGPTQLDRGVGGCAVGAPLSGFGAPRAAVRQQVGTVGAMKPAEFAKVIAPHVAAGWEHVVDVAQPGVTAKVAAVRAGSASTATLDARTAARVVAEAPDPAAITAGEKRASVLAAADGTAAALRRAPTAALFDGTPKQVAAAVCARSTVTPAMIDAYLRSPRQVRDRVASHLARTAEVAGLAAIIAERADALGAEAVATWYRDVRGVLLDFVSRDVVRGRYTAEHRQLGRLPVAAATALARWFAQHGPLGAEITSTGAAAAADVGAVRTTAEAGPGLAAIAADVGVTFAGPTGLGEAALVHARHPSRFLSAAASGVTWSQMRTHVCDTAGSPTDHLEVVCDVLGHSLQHRPRTDAFIAELVATEFPPGYNGPRSVQYAVQYSLPTLIGLLDPVTLLRLAAVTGRTGLSRAPLEEVLARVDTPTVAAICDAEEFIGDHLQGVLAAAITENRAPGRAIWCHAIAVLHANRFAELAATNATAAAHLAAELTRHVETLAGGDDSRRAELWQATCTIAPTLAAPIAEAVHTAAATVEL